jgi:hypothetical protein
MRRPLSLYVCIHGERERYTHTHSRLLRYKERPGHLSSFQAPSGARPHLNTQHPTPTAGHSPPLLPHHQAINIFRIHAISTQLISLVKYGSLSRKNKIEASSANPEILVITHIIAVHRIPAIY